jgi:hypothetical protein
MVSVCACFFFTTLYFCHQANEALVAALADLKLKYSLIAMRNSDCPEAHNSNRLKHVCMISSFTPHNKIYGN